ncbi:hypothetical protein SLE2022_050760 [Rubroshorea leprosula]
MAVAAGEVFASGSQELHVLAVDDSNADRKIIERLLKISSCKATAVRVEQEPCSFWIGWRETLGVQCKIC